MRIFILQTTKQLLLKIPTDRFLVPPEGPTRFLFLQYIKNQLLSFNFDGHSCRRRKRVQYRKNHVW